MHSSPAPRVARSVEGELAQRSPTRVPPPVFENTVVAVLGVPSRARVAIEVHHEVGDRSGRQHHLIAARRQVTRRVAHSRRRARSSSSCSSVDVGEVGLATSAHAERAPRPPSRSARASPLAAHGDAGSPSRCRGTSSRHCAPRTPRAPCRTAPLDRTRRAARSGPSTRTEIRLRCGRRRMRGPRCRRAAATRPRQPGQRRRTPPRHGRGRRRRRALSASPSPRRGRRGRSAMLITVTLLERRTPFVVVVLFANRSSASLGPRRARAQPMPLDAASARLDDLVGGARPASVAHRPDSARVLSTLTLRTSADGQPWLTGATWPGWPLPQLNAPPSR